MKVIPLQLKAKEIKQKGNLLEGNSLCHKIKEKVEDLSLGEGRNQNDS